MKHYIVVANHLIAPDVLHLSLRAEKSRDTIDHLPGQYAAIGFSVKGRPTPMRCFTIASAPNKEGILEFAIRVQGNYTQTLQGLQIGEKVMLRGPFGSFSPYSRYDKSLVLLAGGIGITPFMSMIRQAAQTKSSTPITLLYSNQTAAHIPFQEELLELEKTNPSFQVQFHLTKEKTSINSLPNFHSGRIDQDSLLSAAKRQVNAHTYFICGPTSFIIGMQDLLLAKGTQPERIITEAFSHISKAPSVFDETVSPSTWVYRISALAMTIGFAFIMSLDLARAVPKQVTALIQASQTSVAISSTPSSPVPTSTPVSDTYSTFVQPTATTTPTPVPTTYQAPIQTYRQPVSSVS